MKKYNCTVHGKRMYRIRLNIGVGMDGKPVYKSFYGDGIREAEQKRDAYLAKRTIASPTDTLGKLAHFYTYNVLIHEPYAPATIEQYERMYRNHIKDCPIAITPVSELTRPAVQSFINSLSDISPSALRHTAEYLRKLFRWLSNESYCADLMQGVAVKRTTSPKIDDISVFSPEDVTLIIGTQSPLRIAYLLALTTGVRLGELLALRQSDIQGKSIHICRELNEHHIISADGSRHRVMRIQDTKTPSSIRTIPLTQSAVDALAQLHGDGYLFTTASGGFIDSSDFRRAWKRHLKKAGVQYRKFHACRATYCTMLCKAGVPLETASKLMGHSDISVTAKFYRMVGNDELRSAVDQLDNLIGDKLATTE